MKTASNAFFENRIGTIYKNKLLYVWFQAMHTRIDLLLHGKTETELRSVVTPIFEELKRLEKTANFFDPSSELSQLNQTAYIHPVSVSKDLFQMIDLCIEYNEKTNGYFDVTVHSENYQTDCIKSIILHKENDQITFTQPGIKIDLSGFLKGYALEKVRTILQEYLVLNALVNFGNSSILAFGNHPNGEGWKINNCTIKNQCFSTSGNENKMRQHIISPYTKTYVSGENKISVLSKNGIDGEVLSTALFAATLDKRTQIIKQFEEIEIFYN